MKIKTNDLARDFNIPDVDGMPVSLSQFKGYKVHLVFYRFSGCPNCNLRFHNIQQLVHIYEQHKVALISVYESSVENMKSQIADDTFYSIMIPDASGTLYKLYDLSRSKLKLLYYLLFKGGIAELIAGKKLFKQAVAADGHADTLEAEFLIDENGTIALAHYNRWQGDFIPIEVIKSFIQSKG